MCCKLQKPYNKQKHPFPRSARRVSECHPNAWLQDQRIILTMDDVLAWVKQVANGVDQTSSAWEKFSTDLYRIATNEDTGETNHQHNQFNRWKFDDVRSSITKYPWRCHYLQLGIARAQTSCMMIGWPGPFNVAWKVGRLILMKSIFPGLKWLVFYFGKLQLFGFTEVYPLTLGKIGTSQSWREASFLVRVKKTPLKGSGRVCIHPMVFFPCFFSPMSQNTATDVMINGCWCYRNLWEDFPIPQLGSVSHLVTLVVLTYTQSGGLHLG